MLKGTETKDGVKDLTNLNDNAGSDKAIKKPRGNPFPLKRDPQIDLTTQPKNLIAVIDLTNEKLEYISEDLMLFAGSGANRKYSCISEILPEWKSYLKRVEANGREKRARITDSVITFDNTEKQIEVDAHKVSAPEGDKLVLILRDISEQHLQNKVLEKIFFSSQYAVALINEETKIIGANDHFMKLFKYSLDEISNQNIKVLAPKGLSDEIDRNLRESCSGRIVKSRGFRITRDRRLIEVEILGYPIIHDNCVNMTFILYLERSEKKKQSSYLSFLENILEDNPDGVVISDSNGEIIWSNRVMNHYNESGKWIIGRKVHQIFGTVRSSNDSKTMWSLLKRDGKWNGEVSFPSGRNDASIHQLTIYGVRDEENSSVNYVGIINIKNDNKLGDDKIIDLRKTDTLTGLYNRNYFIDSLEDSFEKIKAYNDELGLMAVDIDNFKEINDSLGHISGDQILVAVSKRISDVLPKQAMVSRFNGDDFFVALPYVDRQAAESVADAIIKKASEPYKINNSTVHLKINIGICLLPENAEDVQSAIRFANIAVYQAAKQGSERICFYSGEMSNEIEENFFISNFLVEAVERNELSMCYQPIMDISTGIIKGIEALMRWNNSILGDVRPDRFIKVAEKTGLIYKIGEWSFREVCKQIRTWNLIGIREIQVSVNVSIKQLEKEGFAESYIKIANDYGVTPASIEIEITESVSTGDVDQIVKNLRALKSRGFTIAMDDFGTGFSSLGQLDVFELDKLKIDKIFIDGIVSDIRKQNLVKAIIAMAGSLNLSVVAEGIEDEKQLSFLKKFGCELGQGYLFSKPLVKDKLEDFYRSTAISNK